jgi:hypothetical protein
MIIIQSSLKNFASDSPSPKSCHLKSTMHRLNTYASHIITGYVINLSNINNLASEMQLQYLSNGKSQNANVSIKSFILIVHPCFPYYLPLLHRFQSLSCACCLPSNIYPLMSIPLYISNSMWRAVRKPDHLIVFFIYMASLLYCAC